MPYIEGETLRQILKKAKANEHELVKPKDIHSSIPALVRIFLQICQACAYAHAQGVLHRDLKPENVIVGKYGQVFILDWGLGKPILETEENDELLEVQEKREHRLYSRITKIGKVVGTIAYMAPERAMGQKATIQTDMYALGVILYQILTLQIPFHRKNLAALKKNWQKEQLVPPEALAPYREVPQILSEITKKCLQVNPEDRYQSVDELYLESIESYLEGRSEWFISKTLDIHNKDDWEFQENVLWQSTQLLLERQRARIG